MTDPTNTAREDWKAITRPIVGIENRTAQEVFDIMRDRIAAAPQPDPDLQKMQISTAPPRPALVGVDLDALEGFEETIGNVADGLHPEGLRRAAQIADDHSPLLSDALRMMAHNEESFRADLRLIRSSLAALRKTGTDHLGESNEMVGTSTEGEG